MFTSPLNRFVSSDEDLQDDMAPTGENMSTNPRPSRQPGKKAGAQGSPKSRSGNYVFNKNHAPDGKPTEPIHFDGETAPGKRTKGVFKSSVSSGQKSGHENMRTNSGFGQKGGKMVDGGAEDYEDFRDQMSTRSSSKSRTSTKA